VTFESGFVRKCGPLVTGARTALASVLDLVYPEICALCGAEQGERPWAATGPVVSGLSWYDGSHLCRVCAAGLAPAVVCGALPGTGIAVYAGRPTGPDLVSVLGQWKYHGVRGLAWPLAPLARAAVSAAVNREGPVEQLVPVALHTRRRRARGFNQAEVLARLAAAGEDVRVRTDLLRRVRSTGQQAKLDSAAARRENVRGAFAAAKALQRPTGRRVGLVDDLVTGGTTCDAAVRALAAAGWQVAWVAVLGLASAAENPVLRDSDVMCQVDTAPVEF